MGKIVISENVSLDGVVQDPTGEEGFGRGGWFGRSAGEDRRSVGQGRARRRRWAPRRCCWVGAATSGSRSAVAVPDRRVGGQVEQPAQVRRVLHPREPRVDQLDGPGGDVVDEVAKLKRRGRRGHRRLRQLPARAHADRARPRRRAAADGLPGRARGRRAPLRRDQRREAPAAPGQPGPSVTASPRSPTRSSGTHDGPPPSGVGVHAIASRPARARVSADARGEGAVGIDRTVHRQLTPGGRLMRKLFSFMVTTLDGSTSVPPASSTGPTSTASSTSSRSAR